MKCLSRQKPLDMDPPQALTQTQHSDSAASRNVLTAPPFEWVREDGSQDVHETAVVRSSGTTRETTPRRPQTKQERRRIQKRLWAAQKRDRERQSLLKLQTTHTTLVTRRERLRSHIKELKVNAQFYRSVSETLREMRAITSNPPHPLPPSSASLSAPPPSPLGAKAEMGATLSTFSMPPPASEPNDGATMLADLEVTPTITMETAVVSRDMGSTGVDVLAVSTVDMRYNQTSVGLGPQLLPPVSVHDPGTMLLNPKVTPTIAMETAAVTQDVESTGVNVRAVSTADMRWNRVPSVADFCEPSQLRVPSSPQSQNLQCETIAGLGPKPLPFVADYDGTMTSPNPKVTPTVAMETAAVSQDVEFTGVDVRAVSTAGMTCSQFACVTSFHGPGLHSASFAPRPQNLKCGTTLTSQLLPSTSASADDGATMSADPEVTPTIAMETAAVTQAVESTGVNVPAVHTADMRWNKIPHVADFRGQFMEPSSPQSQNLNCETTLTPQPSSSVSADDSTALIDPTCGQESPEVLLDWLADFIECCNKIALNASCVENILLDELPSPGPAECCPLPPKPASAEMKLQGPRDVAWTPAGFPPTAEACSSFASNCT